jgi:hypothetical protein
MQRMQRIKIARFRSLSPAFAHRQKAQYNYFLTMAWDVAACSHFDA